jgi:hypothetical protein
MSLGYSYGTLVAALQAWSDNNAADFTANMADIIGKGELQLYHSLDLDNLDPVVVTGAISQISGLVTKPANMIRERVVSYASTSSTPNTTIALLHMTGSAGSNSFPDSTGNQVWTSYGASIVATPSKFGGGALYTGPQTNTPADYISAPIVAGSVNDLFTGSPDFTLEGWVYPTNASANVQMMDYGSASYSSYGISVTCQGGSPNGQVFVSTPVNASSWGSLNSGSISFALNTWHHVAVVRHSGVATLYVDGVSVATQTWANAYGPSAPVGGAKMWVGGTPAATGGIEPGYIDEVRFSNSAIYVANFTPPTAPFTVTITPAGGSPLGLVRRAHYEFATRYAQDAGTYVGPPKYYADASPTQWLCSPIPDQSYTLSVRGVFRPILLADNTLTTNLAGIAALAHPTATVALTLTTSPFVYANANLPSSKLWLYSAGNMSGNSFTVVGLDDDGNAQTEVVVGPNAGSVQTVGVYSQITSVTPSVTDGTNTVSLGWSQDNYTWLSTRFPELLFWNCMQYACQFNKRWTAAKQAEGEIAKLLPNAQMITRSLKRNDFDDLYVSRQNIGAPGAPQLPKPPQTQPKPQAGR